MLRFIRSCLSPRLSPFYALMFMALVHQVSQAVESKEYRCQNDIQKVIKSLDLEGKTISKQSVVDIYQSGIGGSRIEATENWISFKECKGNLVIRADRGCFIEAVYTRGSCDIKDLPNY